MGHSTIRYIAPLETVLFLALTSAAFHPSPVVAQSYCGPLLKVNFNGINGNGQYPTGYLAIDAQSNLHGTTNSGLIWKYSPSTGFTSVSAPSGTTGLNGIVFDSQGNIWGSTSGGGTGSGTIFELTTAGVFSTVFEFSGTNGSGPNPLVFDSQGNLWGSTASGGAANDGT